ncbi:hypothetical protein F5Y15DRAFT_403386 [Xylariaceae sp. FL0016]|nr:hypothetical protein F5Y15DRAFT_403386 [Xylariaceae sp. FL0016]
MSDDEPSRESDSLISAHSSVASRSKGKRRATPSNDTSESTPLLSNAPDELQYNGDQDNDREDAVSVRSHHSRASSAHSSTKRSRRWPSFIAMGILAVIIIAIIVLVFIVPEAVQEYAQKAAVIEPTNLSLDSITTDGLRARIQANFRLDGSRVESDHVRRVGKAATWVAHKLGTEQTEIDVYLPDYQNILLGSAVVPPLVVNLRDGATTHFDFVADVRPGNVEGIRAIANEWLEGRLDKLRLDGKADLHLKSGLIPLGTHTVSESLTFEANKIPAIPQYNITRFNVEDGPFKGSMLADISLSAYNQYPIQLDVPELAFDIMVPGCDLADPYILVAEASTGEVHVEPRADVDASVYAVIRELPDSLTSACPHSRASPLDMLLKQYMHGEPATLFVRGSSHPDGETPEWIADLLASITIPVPFPGRSLDGLIRNFSLTDVHFTLPDPLADPEDPDANPKVSGNILVTAGVPKEMNFGVNVTKVRATADVLYQSRKMGELNLHKWQKANSTRVEGKVDDGPTLKIESRILEAPLNITDGNVFSEVVQALLFGTEPIRLDVDALVDVKIETTLGQLIVKDIPAEGKIPVKPLPKGTVGSMNPKVGSLRVLDTASDSITLQALVNATNPTPYSAHVPYANVHVLGNGSILGEATIENMDIIQGSNTDLLVTAKWNPLRSGNAGRQIGRNLISQFLSGQNTSITVKAHRDSIPGQPILCEVLSRYNMTFAAPRLELPGDTPEERSHFIRDATFHFLSSTATFTLASPLHYNTLYLDFVNATALYNHTEPVGQIFYDLPFSAPPGTSTTPRLPVEWSIGSVGYDAVKQAVGGKLKLDAHANVDVRLGNWKESLWYEGKGIGASVHLT